MAKITVRCPNSTCAKAYVVDESHRGKKGRCKNCDSVFRMIEEPRTAEVANRIVKLEDFDDLAFSLDTGRPPDKSELLRYEDETTNDEIVRDFLGKTKEQAYQMLCSARRRRGHDIRGHYVDGETYCGHFIYMDTRGFEYYLDPAMRYLESDNAVGDSSFASSMVTAAAAQLKHKPPVSTLRRLQELATYVRQNLAKFEIDPNEVTRVRSREIRLLKSEFKYEDRWSSFFAQLQEIEESVEAGSASNAEASASGGWERKCPNCGHASYTMYARGECPRCGIAG